ncbi:unnamed protein product [Effrenium voratum]|nr:unnamed protein product [Effrenium voratum]
MPCCWTGSAVVPEPGETARLPLWQRPDSGFLRSKAQQAVNSPDEAALVERQQRRSPPLPLPYAEPILPEGEEAVALAARPDSSFPLLLVGDMGGNVALYDVEPNDGKVLMGDVPGGTRGAALAMVPRVKAAESAFGVSTMEPTSAQ